MSKEASNNWWVVLIFFFLGVYSVNPFEKNRENSSFIVECPNDKNIFLNLNENEIVKRLGKELDKSKNETGSYYRYNWLTIRCNDGKIDGILIASKKYSILNGVRIGQHVSKIPFNRTLFGYLNILSDGNISNNEIIVNSNKTDIEYKISTKDNLGNARLIFGEVVDTNEPTFNLVIYTGNAKISTIQLYNTIEITGPDRLFVGDL